MTSPAAMAERSFAWALQTRGPVLSEWPEDRRAEALLLLRASPSARTALADALAAAAAAELDEDEDALRRMREAVRRAVRAPTPVQRGLRWGTIAACLAAGLYLGMPAREMDTSPAATGLGTDAPATVLAALD